MTYLDIVDSQVAPSRQEGFWGSSSWGRQKKPFLKSMSSYTCSLIFKSWPLRFHVKHAVFHNPITGHGSRGPVEASYCLPMKSWLCIHLWNTACFTWNWRSQLFCPKCDLATVLLDDAWSVPGWFIVSYQNILSFSDQWQQRSRHAILFLRHKLVLEEASEVLQKIINSRHLWQVVSSWFGPNCDSGLVFNAVVIAFTSKSITILL